MFPATSAEPRSAISRDEFCRRFGISLNTLHREINAGRIQVFKCGRRTLIATSEVEAWPSRLTAARNSSRAA